MKKLLLEIFGGVALSAVIFYILFYYPVSAFTHGWLTCMGYCIGKSSVQKLLSS